MDWKPPTPDDQGRYTLGDWQPMRRAIDAAKRELGEAAQIEQRDWNLVLLAHDHLAHEAKPSCAHCRTRIAWHEVIRCLDCKAPLCERCAPEHFWPNGRPAGRKHR